jgi:hypothetical protein
MEILHYLLVLHPAIALPGNFEDYALEFERRNAIVPSS